jgi:hypothetical protein
LWLAFYSTIFLTRIIFFSKIDAIVDIIDVHRGWKLTATAPILLWLFKKLNSNQPPWTSLVDTQLLINILLRFSIYNNAYRLKKPLCRLMCAIRITKSQRTCQKLRRTTVYTMLPIKQKINWWKGSIHRQSEKNLYKYAERKIGALPNPP